MKEMLVKALADSGKAQNRRIADATAGLIFYACPHLGSWLADYGWNLRYLGASPAAAVMHLKTGAHLQAFIFSRLLH